MPLNSQTAEPGPRRSIVGSTLAILALLVILYFGAYAALGERWKMNINQSRQVMNYSYQWQAVFFRPAARVDSLVFQRRVETDCGFGK
jgi:hypothetical protein